MRRTSAAVVMILATACGSGSQPSAVPTAESGAVRSSAFEAFGVGGATVPEFADKYVRDKAPEVFSTILDEDSPLTAADRRAIAASIIESRREQYELIVVRFFRKGTEDELAAAGFAKTTKAAEGLAGYGFADVGEPLPIIVFRDGPPA